MSRLRPLAAIALCAPALFSLSACAADPLVSPSAPPSVTPSVTPSSLASPSPSNEPDAAHTVLMHDGVLRAALPETFVGPDEYGAWTDGTSTFSCYAWQDTTIPSEGVTAADITATWMAQWSEWGAYSADEVQPFANANGYEDGDVWYAVRIYETAAGDYDFEVWEPHAYLVEGDVFIECAAQVYSPTEAPPYGWDAAFLPMVERVTIVDRPAILTNYWGTERGDY